MATIRSCNSHGSSRESDNVTSSAIASRLSCLPGWSRRQRINGPSPSNSANGAISAVNSRLKKGSPIEILPSPSSLCTSGSSVPSRTTSMAAISKILFPSRNDSRDHSACSTRARTCPPFRAYSSSEPPMATTSSARINSPRVGSEANEWTDTSTPERTRKVPSRHSEKAAIASSTVQARKLPRCSVTARECSSAVPTSHGINEAFSTGSQNHQPPHPSS
ncbi:Uncharacterised protein [Raoultella ornithinolytica]|nr:Uncharacterised protein [Raoultella ornithinolytica]